MGPAISDESERLFKERMLAFGYEAAHVLPHGSYLVNLGNPDSYDLPRCSI
jgi:AP endonuclease-1